MYYLKDNLLTASKVLNFRPCDKLINSIIKANQFNNTSISIHIQKLN